MYYVLTSQPAIMPQILNVESSAGSFHFLLRHTALVEQRHQTKVLAPSSHSHDFFHIVLFLGDKNCFSFNGQAVACEYGTLVITSPWQPHDFGPLRPGMMSYHELTFSLLDSKGRELNVPMENYLTDLFGLKRVPKIPVISTQPDAKVKHICEFFEKECQAIKEFGDKNLSTCYRYIFRLLEYVVEIFSSPAKSNVFDKMDRLEKARDYIGGNYSSDISLDEMAGIANLSKYHFCRAFHKKFGISPKAYQIELRLQAAAQLLKTSGLNCGEISDRLGFSDQYFFSKLFRDRFGVSPRNFMRNIKK